MGFQRVGHDLGTEQQQIREGSGCRAWEEQPRNSSEARGRSSGSRSRHTQNTFELFTELRLPTNGKVKVKVAQLCPTLCNPVDYTVHGILWARILEWVAFPFCRGSSQPRDRTQVSHIAGGFFTSWATREAPTNGRCSHSSFQTRPWRPD